MQSSTWSSMFPLRQSHLSVLVPTPSLRLLIFLSLQRDFSGCFIHKCNHTICGLSYPASFTSQDVVFVKICVDLKDRKEKKERDLPSTNSSPQMPFNTQGYARLKQTAWHSIECPPWVTSKYLRHYPLPLRVALTGNWNEESESGV